MLEQLTDADFRLIRRYDTRGPRYTSYPPATAWSDAVGEDELVCALEAIAHRPRRSPLSIYVHQPFCPSMCWFCACNVLITRRLDLADDYLDHVEREVELLSQHLPGRAVETVQLHWGGGSPTYLSCEQMERLFRLLAEAWPLARNAEVAIEVDPRFTSDEQLQTLRKLGFNRLSLGVQDFDETVQQAVNRIQPRDMTEAFVERVRELGFGSVNIDLIYGLPRQTPESFRRTLDAIVEMRPERLAVYSYAHLPRLKPFQRRIDANTIPSGEVRFAIFRSVLETLLAAGYEYIGMDHFALPGDELARARHDGTLQRNFMGYTTRAGADLIGIGMSSISFAAGLYAQNFKKPKPYYRRIDEGMLPVERGWKLTRDDEIRRAVISDLMCAGRLHTGSIEERFGVRFDQYFARELERIEPMERDGLFVWRDGTLELTLLGRILVRNVAMSFDATLPWDNMDALQRFSRTI